jgi:hypothetical protein
MRTTSLLAFVFVCFVAAASSAQTKLAATQQPTGTVYFRVRFDRPDHVMALVKDKCTWTRGEIGGVQLKDEDDTIVSDTRGNRSRDHGIGVAVLANGDKAFVQCPRARFIPTKELPHQAAQLRLSVAR